MVALLVKFMRPYAANSAFLRYEAIGMWVGQVR